MSISNLNPTSTITIPSSYGTTVGGTITLSGTGTGGQYFTTTGTSTNWASSNTTFNNGNGSAIMTIPYGEDKVVLDEKATLEVKGRVNINGVDLEERLSTIETLLQIPTRDVTMESKHPKLKQLYEQYMYELEKYKTWDRVKGKDE